MLKKIKMSKVSIIIPTYNEEKIIKRCLLSLLEQTVDDVEIIVVDDGSTDNTLSILTEFKDQYSNIKIMSQQHRGPGIARNLGASEASGEILVFVDSDMTFAPIFLEYLIKPIVNGIVKGTFSRDELVSNNENIWSVCWGINEGWEMGKRHSSNHPETQKVFRAILKSEFDKVKGFDATGYTDDWTLSEKLGYLAKNAPGAVFYHENPSNLWEVFNQAKWIGKRNYKLGIIGKLIAIMRASFTLSIIIGIWKSIVNINIHFLVFKLVYDFGLFVGALSSLLGGGNAK